MVTSASTPRSTRQARVSTRSKEDQAAPEDCSGPGGRIRIKAHNHLPVSGKAKRDRREQWRRHIITCAADAIDQADKLGEYGSWLFAVDIEFFLPRQTKNDIDNLAKPVIDTLFSPGVPNGNQNKEITGKVFPRADDLRVMQLNLRKTLVQSDEKCGATITVCWTRVM
jgi:hypothetical protein